MACVDRSDAATDLSGMREEAGDAGGTSVSVLSGRNASDSFLEQES